jgi:hypothetical protein
VSAPRHVVRRGEPRHPAPGDATPHHGLDFERLLFFSDAVFAIAITLLIIEVHLPELPPDPTDQDIAAGLQVVLPQIFAYGLSFATIGLYWLAHWRRYRYVDGVDERLVAINLLLLGPLTWLYAWRAGLVRPGVTATFARYAAFRGFSVPLVMLGSLVLLPVIGPTGVEISWLLILPVQLLLNRYLHSLEPPPGSEHGAA